jgi:hypothetical protein
MKMKTFFEKPTIDQTYADALEKRLVSVYGHENKREWRGLVWPMASFGLVLILVLLVVGKQYGDTNNSRLVSAELNAADEELVQLDRDMRQDSEINEAFDYLGM